ncbi:hypothetical protein D3C87_2110210 [compost metagenome]
MPAAGGQTSEDRGARRGFVQVERLGIELRGECLDLIGIDAYARIPFKLLAWR